MNTIIDGASSISPAEIERFEQKNGFLLPNDYRDFLLKYNGGYADKKYFWVRGWGTSLASSFCGINVSRANDLQFNLDSLQYSFGKWRRQVVPFSTDPGGLLILLGVVGDKYGKVYIWDHDSASPRLIEIAPSFSDFFNGLYADDDECYEDYLKDKASK